MRMHALVWTCITHRTCATPRHTMGGWLLLRVIAWQTRDSLIPLDIRGCREGQLDTPMQRFLHALPLLSSLWKPTLSSLPPPSTRLAGTQVRAHNHWVWPSSCGAHLDMGARRQRDSHQWLHQDSFLVKKKRSAISLPWFCSSTFCHDKLPRFLYHRIRLDIDSRD